MLRSITAVALVLSVCGTADAGSHENEANGIVAPSEYVESIETEGDSGGVMDEVDAGEAQAEAAEAAAKAAKQKAAEDEGGW